MNLGIPNIAEVVARGMECYGTEYFVGKVDIDTCADLCKRRTSMFIFGTVFFGESEQCDEATGKCSCFCETAAASDGTCKQMKSTYYDLYKFKGIFYSIKKCDQFPNTNFHVSDSPRNFL